MISGEPLCLSDLLFAFTLDHDAVILVSHLSLISLNPQFLFWIQISCCGVKKIYMHNLCWIERIIHVDLCFCCVLAAASSETAVSSLEKNDFLKLQNGR